MANTDPYAETYDPTAHEAATLQALREMREKTGLASVGVGRADRPVDFAELCDRADSFQGFPGLNTAAVKGTVLRAVRSIRHRRSGAKLTPSAVHLLVLVIDHIYAAKPRGDHAPPNQWETGNLTVYTGNERLALMLGVSQRTVRTLLRELEDHGWLIRRYDHLNHRRGGAAGLDLRILGARLPELWEAERGIDETIAARREERRMERDDVAVLQAQEEILATHEKKMEKESGGEDQTIPQKYKVKNPGGKAPVHGKGASQVKGGLGTAGAKGPNGGVGRYVPDEELIFLMVHASPTLAGALPQDRLMNPDAGDIGRAIETIRRFHFPTLSPAAWTTAMKFHREAAWAAMLVATERLADEHGRPLRDRTKYLAGMLKKSNLRMTVIHSLRKLAASGLN